jgi:hypothetical protein
MNGATVNYTSSHTNQRYYDSIVETTYTFPGCTWNTLGPVDDYGGAISVSNKQDVTLIITECIFDNVNVSSGNWGGAIYIYILGTLSLTSSNVTNTSAGQYGGAAYINNIKWCVVIHRCLFEDCTATNYYVASFYKLI